jgi:hypothetical protein
VIALVKAAGGAVYLTQRENDELHRCLFGAFASGDLMEAWNKL